MIRYGEVTSVFPERGTVKVTFQDIGIPSAELPVLQGRTHSTKRYSLPKLGETGICIFPENSFSGFYLGGGNNEIQTPPPEAGEGIEVVQFSDGTIVAYNENTSLLTINCKGEISIKATNINIVGPKIKIKGDIDIDGGIKTTKDIVAGNISLQNHLHLNIKAGVDKSGGPV